MDAKKPTTIPRPEPVEPSNEKPRDHVTEPTSPIRLRTGLRAGAALEQAGDNPSPSL
jgi:hypothetical protein